MQPLKTKLYKIFSSLFTIYFTTLCFISCLVILFSLSVFYNSTKQNEKNIFHSARIKSENNILTYVSQYNRALEKLYTRQDLSDMKVALAKLDNLGNDFEKINTDDIVKIGKDSGFSILLLDAKSKIVLATSESRKSFLHMNLTKEFTTLGPLLKTLKPGRINVRYSWMRSRGRLQVFLRLLTHNKRYIWSIRKDFRQKSRLDHIIKYLRTVNKNHPFIDKIGVYTEEQLTNHGLKDLKLPSDLKKSLQKKTCESPFSCNLWYQINTPKNFGQNTQFIKYVGIQSKSKLKEKTFSAILSNLYIVVIFSVLFSLILSYVVSNFLVKAIYRITDVTNKVESNLDLKARVPKLWNNELDNLGSAFNKLLKRLSLKEKENQKLSNDILATADNERSRISSDLHDTVGQLLVAANLKLGTGDTKGTKEVIQLACDELRNIYHRLDPSLLKNLSFQEAVEWYLLKFFPKNFSYTLDLELADNFSDFIKVQLYRIMQEIIANTKKHSPEGKFLRIMLLENDSNILLIAENDINEKVCLSSKKKSGLKNISLRVKSLGGEFSITTTNSIFKIYIKLKSLKRYYKEN